MDREPDDVVAEASTAVGTAQAHLLPPSLTITAEVAKAVAEAPEEPGNLTRLELTKLGRRPYNAGEVVPAWWRLKSTHESVTGLFDTLHLVRKTRATQNNKSTRGRCTPMRRICCGPPSSSRLPDSTLQSRP